MIQLEVAESQYRTPALDCFNLNMIQLEVEERGPYAGAVGYFSYNGCCDFAIAIRSIFIENTKGFVQSGAGIVSDSIAENEFKETEHKAGAMLQALKEASD